MTTIITKKGTKASSAIYDGYKTLEDPDHPIVEAEEKTVPHIPGIIIPSELIPFDVEGFREYMGYRIEKQKYNYETRKWEHLANIYVSDINQNEHFDTRISYNQHYRYRMYTIMRVFKDGSVKNFSLEYSALLDRLIELAPEAEDILKMYGTQYNVFWVESYPSKWQYIRILDRTPPQPPEYFQIWPMSDKGLILLSWSKPINLQKDIVKYRLYRRDYGKFNWTLIFEGGTRDNVFMDKGIEYGKKYVYAVQCVDIHGLSSTLSVQWSAQLNSSFLDELEEYDIEMYQNKGETISKEEDDYEYMNVHYNITNDDFFGKELIAQNKFSVVPNAQFPGNEKDFIIKVISLDTGEEHEIVVNCKKEVVSTDPETATSSGEAHPSTIATPK